MRTIGKCPVCGSDELIQKFRHFIPPIADGGTNISREPILDGVFCDNCGTPNTFDKKGSCPNCDGTGEFVERSYHSGLMEHEMSRNCITCKGKGEI